MSHSLRLLLVLACFSLGWVHADEVDDFVRAEMQKQEIPGLSLAVVKAGVIEKVAGYGFANLEWNTPVAPDTVFQIQSVTKTFTASAVMLLVEQGKVALDDNLTNFFGDLPKSWSGITVRHLLTHTSGLKDFINEPTVDLRKDLLPTDVIESLRAKPLNFPPGEKYAYSNTGYHLLGMIIRKVTGQSWDEFIQEKILTPLEMRDTRVVNLSAIITNRAAGYVWENGRIQNGHFVAPTILGYAGGGFRSTALDLAKWDAALYGAEILKPSTLEQMWTPAVLNNGSNSTYGFGWGISKVSGHRLISHTGSHATGFKAILARFVDDQLTVIILTNQRNANQTAIANRVAAFYLPGLKVKEPTR
jgi:CubicO group peptidase (beta-lactamase class C family)